jgi:hypothetical protein
MFWQVGILIRIYLALIYLTSIDLGPALTILPRANADLMLVFVMWKKCCERWEAT